MTGATWALPFISPPFLEIMGASRDLEILPLLLASLTLRKKIPTYQRGLPGLTGLKRKHGAWPPFRHRGLSPQTALQGEAHPAPPAGPASLPAGPALRKTLLESYVHQQARGLPVQLGLQSCIAISIFIRL